MTLAERASPGPTNGCWRSSAGLLAVELAVQSSVAMLPYISFPMHVVQILLLVVVAAPLLVLGAPVALALETASAADPPAPARPRWGQRRRGRCRIRRCPLSSSSSVCSPISSPAALAASMRHVWLLNLINLGFLAAALLFWWAALGTDAIPEFELRAGAAIWSCGRRHRAGVGARHRPGGQNETRGRRSTP